MDCVQRLYRVFVMSALLGLPSSGTAESSPVFVIIPGGQIPGSVHGGSPVMTVGWLLLPETAPSVHWIPKHALPHSSAVLHSNKSNLKPTHFPGMVYRPEDEQTTPQGCQRVQLTFLAHQAQ